MVKRRKKARRKIKSKDIKVSKNVKIIIFAIVLAIILAIIISSFYQNYNRYSFEKGFSKIRKIDIKYNTSIYTEGLDPKNRYIVNNSLYFPWDWNKTLVDVKNVDPMIVDLDELKEKIEGMEKTDDTEALLLLIEARKKMLESERLFQLGEAIGPVGTTKNGFFCRDKPYILNASDLLNRSTIIGQEATGILDDILNYYPKTRAFLSEENRPKFFDSPFWPISKSAKGDKGVILYFCSDKE